MKYTLLISVFLATLSLNACVRPEVVTAPVSPVAVPGSVGATGADGSKGTEITTGEKKIWIRRHGHRDALSFSLG